MQPRHVALAIALSVIWGMNFVVISVGLTGFPPLLMAGLRFSIAALPAFFLPRPSVSWKTLLALSLTLFVGQFAFSFPAMAIGMPPGLMSIILQVQAFITVGIAAATLHEHPNRRQMVGAAVTLAGLAVIAGTIGTNGVTAEGLLLALGSAVSWSIGNVILRHIKSTELLPLISWLSLLAAPVLLVLSFLFEGPAQIEHALTHASWLSIGAVLYIALISTTFGYGAWAVLLKIYPTAVVAPFSLIVPVAGTISAALLLGEKFGPMRLAGMVLILVGLALPFLRQRETAAPASPHG